MTTSLRASRSTLSPAPAAPEAARLLYTSAAPRFEVRMIMECLKDTTRPWLSLTRPSSRICGPQNTVS